MEQDLISIVVPVYRAENYIEETLDCVRAQTYTNWELLLIEDCGPDRSRQLIEEYIRRTGDRRIRLTDKAVLFYSITIFSVVSIAVL